MGAYLSAPRTEKETETYSSESFDVAVSAMQGWRTGMEDAHVVDVDADGRGAGLFGVFDGHGGREVAIFVAEQIKNVLKANKSFKDGSGDVSSALSETFVALDELMLQPPSLARLKELRCSDPEDALVSNAVQIVMSGREDESDSAEKSKEREELAEAIGNSLRLARAGQAAEDDQGELDAPDQVQAGCTAVCAYVTSTDIVVANSGDSRAVLCRGGVAMPLSRDHKPTDEDEFERITKAGGTVMEGRVNGSLNLSRALGDMEYKRNKDLSPAEQMVTAVPEIKTVKRDPTDEFLLVACDGIWDVFNNQEACTFVRERLAEGMTPPKICEAMCDHCLAPDTNGPGHGCDNMTAMVVLLKK